MGRFGKFFEEEIGACKNVAQGCGILVDPVYTLAAWEVSCQLAMGSLLPGVPRDNRRKVFMLHTGGSLGLFAVAQRFPRAFVSGNEDR